ncbi:hypothetical protein MNV49_005647 [Pseudohyphozyma bogoriensis]|nr:hypothetical protein MNV49_005647 [Pseudohyphozyma bogoriensis]
MHPYYYSKAWFYANPINWAPQGSNIASSAANSAASTAAHTAGTAAPGVASAAQPFTHAASQAFHHAPPPPHGPYYGGAQQFYSPREFYRGMRGMRRGPRVMPFLLLAGAGIWGYESLKHKILDVREDTEALRSALQQSQAAGIVPPSNESRHDQRRRRWERRWEERWGPRPESVNSKVEEEVKRI